jgi:Putative peptidoglycan binding domain
MSDIGLLMTSLLEMGQKISSNLPQQLLVQHENDLFQATSEHLLNSTATLQVTPPEFTQFGDTYPAPVFSRNDAVKNILGNFLFKIIHQKLLRDLESNKSQSALGNFVAEAKIIADAGDSVMTVINRRRTQTSLPNLEFGADGISVRVLQRLLVSNGYGMEIDGFFGALTEAAVRAFQNRRSLVVDGVVGQNTWRELTR